MRNEMIVGFMVICFISLVSAGGGNYSSFGDVYTYATQGGAPSTHAEPSFIVGIHNTLGFTRGYMLANFSNVSGDSLNEVILHIFISDITGADSRNMTFTYCNNILDETIMKWDVQDTQMDACNATSFYNRTLSNITDDAFITVNVSKAPEVLTDTDAIFTIKFMVNPESGSTRRRWEIRSKETATVNTRPFFIVTSTAGGVNPFPAMVKNLYSLSPASFSIVGDNSTAWRVDTNISITTSDVAPTIIASTDVNADCRLGITDSNFTTLGASRNCDTTGAVNHTCTLIAADFLKIDSGDNSLFIGCRESTGDLNETVVSTSGPLNVTLDLYIINGTVKTQGGVALEDAIVILFNETNNAVEANTTTNASGVFHFEIPGGANWTVQTWNTSIINGVMKRHVQVP